MIDFLTAYGPWAILAAAGLYYVLSQRSTSAPTSPTAGMMLDNLLNLAAGKQGLIAAALLSLTSGTLGGKLSGILSGLQKFFDEVHSASIGAPTGQSIFDAIKQQLESIEAKLTQPAATKTS